MMKEILKNEILTEEQLGNIAGGNRDELALDTQLFNTMGGRIKAYDLADITNTNVRGITGKINSLYSKLGIKVEYNDLGASKYYINGKCIPRNQIVMEALNRAGYHNVDSKQFMI